MREMIRELEKEGARDIGITPDGPRGPRGKVQDGVLVVAAASGLSITPVTTRVSWKWHVFRAVTQCAGKGSGESA